MQRLGVGSSQLGDLDERPRELLDGLPALRLRGFAHERPLDDERKEDRGRMKSAIDEPLGHVQCGDPAL